MIHEFADVPLLPVDGKPKIRFRKLAKKSGKRAGNIPKSFKAFSKAQKEYAEERKAQNRKQNKIEAEEKYLAKKERKKRKC
ncbi:MAG: hypothetical protein MJ182_10280 [Treponema sp.]|nr:hypothetical protein [Treponema sp.]